MPEKKNLPHIIKDILGSRSPTRIRDEALSYKHAGVLIPLLEDGGVYKILFTERTHTVEHHKGQISFPGGAVDDDDDSVKETVLREAYEEIGLQGDDVEILGRIDDTLTVVSNFIVHPYVGLIPHPYEFTVNTAEVERVIMVPLSVFHPENTESKRQAVEFEGMTFQTQAYEYGGDVIWGATARMMDNFMNIIGPRLHLPEDNKSVI